MLRFSVACLLCALSGLATAQYNTGLPTVGNTASPKDSQVSVDAKQFLNPPTVSDMCAAIASACSSLASSGYPVGATIDARGFTGNQCCKDTNATTMLNNCVPAYSTNARSGKLLLGEVNIYVDNPSGGSYTYGTGSGPGTPAIVIPNGFWGIEGISRAGSPGATNAVGTFISNHITGC